MGYLLGLDIGTSAVKALLLKVSGELVGDASAEYPLFSPRPGWSEQNPEDMWQATVEAIKRVLGEYGVDPASIRGIGLSGQMHGAVLLDRADRVLRPCILWNDTRSHVEAATLDADPRFRKITGNIVFPGFT
ncbi:MAG: FGGY family carbohydrate kinase, partial [Limnochordia bacterium]